jgi:hypothetical protein
MTQIMGGVGAALAFAAASGGKIYAYNNLGVGAAVVAPANPGRTQITFHNPGIVDIFVAPSVALNAAGSQAALNPTTAALGGCFRVFANGGTLVISGECQGAWQAFSASATNNPLTVMDSNL